MQVHDEIVNYWHTDKSDECELFFQQVDCNIEKREKGKEEYSSAKIFEEL
jgi:hypothetical protein